MPHTIKTSISAHPSKTPRSERVALLVMMVLVTYGSFFPFNYAPHQAGWTDIYSLLSPPAGKVSVTDIVGNVLLFIPPGALLAMPRLKAQRWVLLFGCIMVAALIQYFQFWFPDRDPSGLDALLNVFGIFIGLGLGSLALAMLWRWNFHDLPNPQWVPVATGFLLLWIAYRWFPLVPTLDLQNVKDGVKPLLRWDDLSRVDVLRNFVGWLVFLRLMRSSTLQRVRYLGVVGISLVVLLSQPMFAGNLIRPSHVVGCLLALLLFPFVKTGKSALGVVTVLLALSITLSALAPAKSALAQEQWLYDVYGQTFSWVPFSGFLQGSLLTNVASLIEKCFLYGSLLFFLRCLGLTSLLASLLVVPALFALEWAQQSIPGRTPEITDPLLALLLAWGLYALMQARDRSEAAHRQLQSH